MSKYNRCIKACKVAGKQVEVNPNAKPEWRWCNDIGMYAIDRDMASCAKTASPWCKEHCYNFKLFYLYKAMPGCDARLKQAWANFDAKEVNASLAGKRKQVKRVRLATRGEAINCVADVLKIAELAGIDK